jgi:hypothetical protein
MAKTHIVKESYKKKGGDWFCPWTHTCTTTHRNKTVNVDKIKHTFIVLILPTKSVFKH